MPKATMADVGFLSERGLPRPLAHRLYDELNDAFRGESREQVEEKLLQIVGHYLNRRFGPKERLVPTDSESV